MKRWLQWVTGAAAVLVVCVGVALGVGTWRQRVSLGADLEQLVRSGVEHGDISPPSAADLDALPAPVARYLRLVIPNDARIDEVRLGQIGMLRADLQSENWMPFVAEHVVNPSALGFVWSARVKIAPLLHIRVRDSLLQGQGSGQVALMSAVTIDAAGGTPEMTSGSLHRYLAEAPWYPTALYPGPSLRWTAIDDSAALATLTDHGTTVSLEFGFADSGEITSIYTPARWGRFGDTYGQAPWKGHFQRYQRRGDMLVPTEADVGWYVDGEWKDVWRGTVTSFRILSRRTP